MTKYFVGGKWPFDTMDEAVAFERDLRAKDGVFRAVEAMMPVIARLTGRCRTGSERGGFKTHAVLAVNGFLGSADFSTALCGAKPGRLSNGWVEVDGPEATTCRRCQRKAEEHAAETRLRADNARRGLESR